MSRRTLATPSRDFTEGTSERSAEPRRRPGPTDPAVAAVLELVLAFYADGLPTAWSYVARRLRESGIDVADDVITSACGWAPYRPEPRTKR